LKEQSIIEVGESRPAWEALETYAREGIPHLLEEELEERFVESEVLCSAQPELDLLPSDVEHRGHGEQ
jgi:hypothetical protein